MAPRKTKTETTAVDPDQLPDNAALIEAVTALVAGAEAEQSMPLNINNMTVNDLHRIERFEVAKAMLPAIYPYVGTDDCLDDENRAGATARLAFEYADAFIAYSRKGGRDGEA